MSPRDARVREGHEPDEMPRGLPWFVVAVTLGITAWGAWYFWSETGNGDFVLGDRRTPAALMAASPDAGGGEGGPDGAALYSARCAACHQGTGMGLAGAFPPLGGSRFVVGDPEYTTSILLLGLQGEVEVAGTAYNGVMPSFAADLGDAEIAAVLTHVRTSFGNDAGPVTEEQVATRRAELGERGAIQGEAELETLVQ